MNTASPRLIALTLLFFLPLLNAREPQTSPPPVSQLLRARALAIPFEGTPGALNAITDVAGVEVGYSTLISGEGKLEVGKGPVRTGVTAILPRGRTSFADPVYAGYFSLNGNGEMTGAAWLEEGGFLEGPVMITNTHSVGVVRDATIAWRVAHGGPDAEGFAWSLPVVAETWDGPLNDINGFHVKPEHVAQALDSAHGGAVEEGSVGDRMGEICYEFKGGNGSADPSIALSTANPLATDSDTIAQSVGTIPNDRLDPMFTAVVQATEEAVVNALLADRGMTGTDTHGVGTLPHDRRRGLLKK